MQASLVPVPLVDQVWPLVCEGFNRASQRSGGDITVAELWIGCRSGHCFLFTVHSESAIVAATIWRSEAWGRGQRFRCLALYGKDMKAWKDILREHVVTVAKCAGCTGLIADGRLGWKKILPEAVTLKAIYEAPI